jgi:hypothetical protein
VAADKNESDDGSRCNALQCKMHADFKGHLFWAKRPGGSSWEIFY